MCALTIKRYVAIAVLLVATSCYDADGVSTTFGSPLVLPDYGQLGITGTGDPGETIIVLLDTNVVSFLSPNNPSVLEMHDVYRERVTVKLDIGGEKVAATFRSVLEAELSANSERSAMTPGATVMAALFDLPNVDAFTTPPPTTGQIEVYFDDDGIKPPDLEPTPFSVVTPNVILPTPVNLDAEPHPLHNGLYSATLLADLEPTLTHVRFQPKFTTAVGERVGAVQFDFEIFDCGAALFGATTASEASPGMLSVGALVGGPAHPTQYRIIYVNPEGFELPMLDSALGTSGEGPLFDLRVVKAAGAPAGCASDTSWFEIDNLIVSDIDGNPILTHSVAVDSSVVPIDTRSAEDPLALLRAFPIDRT